jgi:alkanesulfonate monooxygenase SsuD/methylene tetrahydromethanopterin reductase-like flavin-dependent oxidoreductase (luciferase family)
VRHITDPVAVARKWRTLAEQNGWSIRRLVIETQTRVAFVGTPRSVAETIIDRVQSDAADGYILVPHLTPHGLDEFVDLVVPELQERGAFRTDYTGTTLRDHLDLARPASPLGSVAAKARP